MMLSLALFLAAQNPVAILESGRRVEVSTEAAPGARILETPYGVFRSSFDPVVQSCEADGDFAALQPLREKDYGAWLDRMRERGAITQLLQDQAPSGMEHLRLDALEAWGRELDPLDDDLDRDRRVAVLWDRLEGADAGMQALCTGALLREVSLAAGGIQRRVSTSDLLRGFRSQDPGMRRAACRLATHQMDGAMLSRLSELSLEDSSASVRPCAADSAVAMDEERALGRWAAALWRADREQQRMRAAEHLGRFGEDRDDVLKTLIYALGSSAHQAPGRYAFFGRQISVVTDFDVQIATSARMADPQISVITEGAVLQIRVISTNLSRSITSSLQRLTGEDLGSDREAWIAWYRQQNH